MIMNGSKKSVFKQRNEQTGRPMEKYVRREEQTGGFDVLA